MNKPWPWCPTKSSKVATGKQSLSVVGECVVEDEMNKQNNKRALPLAGGKYNETGEVIRSVFQNVEQEESKAEGLKGMECSAKVIGEFSDVCKKLHCRRRGPAKDVSHNRHL